jgi:proteic killer suppression protein
MLCFFLLAADDEGTLHFRIRIDAWPEIAHYNALRYSVSMIQGFADPEAELIWSGRRSRRLPSDIQNVALRKLRLLNQARVLADLRVPPGNRLEALKADRQGQHSIRINDQWRICFVWDEGGPSRVEIVDYHV